MRELGKPSPAPGLRRLAREAMGAYKRSPREVASGREGGGGARSTDRAVRTTEPAAMGRGPASSVLRRRGKDWCMLSGANNTEQDKVRELQVKLYLAAKRSG